VKVGGFGSTDALSAVNRFEQTKLAVEAKASAAPEKDTEKSVVSSSSSAVTKRATRPSELSKQNAKDFSRILSESEKSEIEEDSDPSEVVTATAVATSFATPAARPVDRPENPEQRAESHQKSGSLDAPNFSPIASVRSSKSQVGEGKLANGEAATAVDDKINDIVESLEQTADTELSMRHISMREFLGKMQGEFGIEPQQIVKAFANLDQAALQAPPEQTAEAVLSQLNLKPEQLPKAQGFYREMLNQTGESALNETMVGVGAGVTLKVLSEQDLAMDKLQKSIVSLNDAFARREDVAPEVVASPLAIALQNVSAQAAPIEIAPIATEAVETTEVATISKPEAEIIEKKEPKSGQSKFAALGAAISAASASLAGASSSGTGSSESEGRNSNSETPKSKEFNSIESALSASGFNISNSSEKVATPLMAGTSTAAALATAVANQDGDTTTSNAQNLVRNAQILMKSGGGEMKMQLKPEGVGEVTLKVAVKDGQVAIQMMTESDSAKKMLESNLDDLKTSLAQHKLHVDALKIEVGGELAKQRFEQAQQDTNREQARQMAQDFMGQFREDRQGFRQGFFDQSGFRNYRQPSGNPLPAVETVVASSESQKKSTGERRLNLVA
jgi:flagellar hook-length control protein FliK